MIPKFCSLPPCSVLCAAWRLNSPLWFLVTQAGQGGRSGTPGLPGEDGSLGRPGSAGGSGGAGVNGGTGGQGAGDLSGLAAAGGSGGAGPPTTTRAPGGAGGAAGGRLEFAAPIGPLPEDGADGARGPDGSRGSNGQPGFHARSNAAPGQNVAIGPRISGGGGGGGGAGGNGGGGGGGGSGGGSGGGGGVWVDTSLSISFAGGDGGAGGNGGNGSIGGVGGRGGDGQKGGGGGGAISIEALGRLVIESDDPVRISVNGAASPWNGDRNEGSKGQTGLFSVGVTNFGKLGEPGEKGFDIELFTGETSKSASGGQGGTGGRGGSRSQGGDGGDGSSCAPGAGGTAKFAASFIEGAGQRALVSANAGPGESNESSRGRALVAVNAGDLQVDTGGRLERFSGPMAEQPFLPERMVRITPFRETSVPEETPYIPDLVDGAETYGILAGINAQDPFFSTLLPDFDSSNNAALLRTERGPGPHYDILFEGYDWLFFLNLGADPLLAPNLGVVPGATGSEFTRALQVGGYLRDFRFFDAPTYDVLRELPGHSVFTMLVPDTEAQFNFGGNGLSASGRLATGDSLALNLAPPAPVPLPASVLLLASGAGALVGLRRRRR